MDEGLAMNKTPPQKSDNRLSANQRRLWGTFALVMRKFVWLAIVFLGITLVSFFVLHLAPGSPTELETTLNPLADLGAQQRLNTLYGLDKPLPVQYKDWLFRLLALDFGDSMSADARPVMTKIAERLPFTLWFNGITLLLSLLIAIPIGVFSAHHKDGFFDKASTIIVFIGFAMPGFWLALLLILLFSIELQWVPVSGLTSIDYDGMTAFGKAKDIAAHLALPLFVTTFGSLAGLSRFARTSVLDALRQDYIVTARAKGLPERIVLFRHALGNALLPLITLLGLSIPGLIGGSVIIESIFSLPGMGQLFYTAVLARDYSLIMGNLVLGAVLTLAGNFLADLCYGLADPRIRTGQSQDAPGL